MTNRKLNEPCVLFRSTVVRGADAPQVERDGGRSGAGVIHDVAIITRGEALGHDVWIDREFLHQTADAINAVERGLKSRFTHPGLSGDGMGKYLGRVFDARVDGDVVRGDLHLSPTAHDTPDGNLAEYVLDLAEIEPDMFGLSIVFTGDPEAEAEHKAGNERSPDPANAGNLPHARLHDLLAVDVVDEPAANPGGLFHRADDVAAEADGILSYALGMTTDKPKTVHFDVDAGRVAGFVSRFLARHRLEIKRRETEPMSENATAEAETVDEVATDETETVVAEDETADDEQAETVVAEDETADDETETNADLVDADLETVEAAAVVDGQTYLDAFGDQGGVWFAEGKTFDECRELYVAGLERDVAELRTENERLRADLSAGEGAALSFGGEADPAAEAIAVDEKRMGRTAAVLRRAIRISQN